MPTLFLCKNMVFFIIFAFLVVAGLVSVGVVVNELTVVKNTTNLTALCQPTTCVGAFLDANDKCQRSYLDEVLCDDNNPCTKDDRCTGGLCNGRPLCETSNPCNIVECREFESSTQCVVAGTLLSCREGCFDDMECAQNFICVAGVCKEYTTPVGDSLSVIAMTQQYCGTGSDYRLAISLDYTSVAYTYGTSLRSRKLASTELVAEYPANFIESIHNLRYEFSENLAHSQFDLWTPCTVLTEANCDTEYLNRRYRFALPLQDCAHASSPPLCQTYPAQSFQIQTNYINCLPFNYLQVAAPVDQLNATLQGDTAVVMALDESSTFEKVTLCVVDPLARLANCARNDNNTACARRGCLWQSNNPTLNPITGTPTAQTVWENNQPTFIGQFVQAQVEGNKFTFLVESFNPGDEIIIDAVMTRQNLTQVAIGTLLSTY
ncbi:hypothetical protein OAU26_03780 [Mariniblastus sp.]|nr:hypothetical protein [Mariniblastus sp.]